MGRSGVEDRGTLVRYQPEVCGKDVSVLCKRIFLQFKATHLNKQQFTSCPQSVTRMCLRFVIFLRQICECVPDWQSALMHSIGFLGMY
jgi:hypothetical protein